MCDYSLHAVETRPAEVAETLVSTKFKSTTTRGFASPDNPQVAVCLRPGTKPAVSCFVRKSAIGWHGFDRLASTSRPAIMTHWNSQMVRSFSSPISQLGKGLRYCNCLPAQWRKGLRRLNLRFDMRLPTSDGLSAPDVSGPSRFGPPCLQGGR